MFTNNNLHFKKDPSQHLLFWGAALALLAGLILSTLSWLEFCVEHCAANQEYRLFNLPFAFVGIPFFSFILLMHLFSRSYPFLSKWVGWMIASALGAELIFILVQNQQIGHWCPVCLSIFFSLVAAALCYSSNYIKLLLSIIHERNRGNIMKKIGTGLTSIPFFFLGILLAFVGVSKHDAVQAAENDIKSKIAFGMPGSPIEVYFASDWFCPSCRKLEFMIEKLLPEIKSDTAFYFIDYPVHQKSLNFSPYNLAFMINDKEHYFKARHLLFALTEDTNSPKEAEVEKAAKEAQLTYTPLSYVDIKAGLDYFDKIVKQFDMGFTPTVVVTNIKTKKIVKLEGTDQITEDKILKAIKKLKN